MFFQCLLLTLSAALFATAEIYVTRPSSGSACHGGQPCTVEWLDDGNSPLLSSIGLCKVALYTGHLQLIQTLTSVNVSESHSFTFTPDPNAGPNSDAYYISFTPTSDTPYRGFSPWFALDGMRGSFDTATSSIATTPTSMAGQTSSAATMSGGTSIVPTTSTETFTSTPSSTGTPTSSGFSTVSSLSSSASLSSTRTSATTSPTRSNAAIANTFPAAGLTWILMAFLGFSLV